MATSTPANANSPANISPVGPAPAITTAWLVVATLRSPRDPFVDNNTLILLLPFPSALEQVGDPALQLGSGRKPPGAVYSQVGDEQVLLTARPPRKVIRPTPPDVRLSLDVSKPIDYAKIESLTFTV
jgi:hypothetical protein